MTILVKTSVKTYFETGDRPTQSQFGDFIDSTLFLAETTSQTIVGSVIVSGTFQAAGGFSANGGTVSLTSAALQSPVITSGSINSTSIGSVSAATGSFTAITIVSGLSPSNLPTPAASSVLQAATNGQTIIEIDSFAAGNQFFGFRSNGTPTARTKVSAGQVLNSVTAGGYDGISNTAGQAALRLLSSNDWTTTDHSTFAIIMTTSAGSTTMEEAIRIDAKKNNLLSYNGSTGVIATGATDGMPAMPTCAGSKTGTPTAYTGMAQYIYDTTNNKMWIWNPISAAWKSATFA